MKNLRDPKTKIYPSTTRGGKELPSSSALDSPSVLSKLATPKPAYAIKSDRSHVVLVSQGVDCLICFLRPLGLRLCLLIIFSVLLRQVQK